MATTTTSRKAERETLRNGYLSSIVEFLTEKGEEILMTASNEFCFPVVGACGNDDFITVKITVPTGTRDGKPFDGYAAAEDYAIHCAEMKDKADKAAEAKAKKIAKAKAEKEAKAAAKAKHEAEKAAE